MSDCLSNATENNKRVFDNLDKLMEAAKETVRLFAGEPEGLLGLQLCISMSNGKRTYLVFDDSESRVRADIEDLENNLQMAKAKLENIVGKKRPREPNCADQIASHQ